MTIYSDILRNHGIQFKTCSTYGQPSLTSAAYPTLQQGVDYYVSQGFGIYVFQDMSDGYVSNINDIYAAFKLRGGGLLSGCYGWGYATGFMFACATKYPDDQEYYLVSGALAKAANYGLYGIVQDSPNFLAEWVKQYQAMDAGLGLGKLIGLSGWPKSDHGVNYAGAQGANGGHNMRTYTRYVNNAFYMQDVNSSGAHLKDSTPCLLWGLRGVNPNIFTGQVTVTVTGSTYSGGVIPTVAMATDLSNYHRYSRTAGFIGYYAAASAPTIELTLLQMIQAKGFGGFALTAVPLANIQSVPAFFNSPIVQMESSNFLLNFGGKISFTPYFNYAQPLDNSSNPGGGYAVATPQTVIGMWTDQIPYWSHIDVLDVDTAGVDILRAQELATRWTHYANIWNKIPVGGWFGNELNALPVLVIDHYYGNLQTWSALGSVCNLWGADAYFSLAGYNLNQFKVVVGLPDPGQDGTFAADIAQLRTAVNAGTNLILWSYPSYATDLTGQGTTAVPITLPHPIWAPYTKTDVDAVRGAGNYGTINQFGAGKVVVLPLQYGGEAFSATGNVGNPSDSLSSGLAWVVLNAVLWLGGQPTPAMSLPQYVKRTAWAGPLNNNGGGTYSGVGIHVLGQKNGAKTILLSSSKTVAQPVAFNLDSAFYGFPASYSLRDVNTGQVISGSGSSIPVNVTIPPQDLMAFVSTTSQTPTTITVSARPH